MENKAHKARLRAHLYLPYIVMIGIYFGFILVAFAIDEPADVIDGFFKIVTSRSILVTDYIAVGAVNEASGIGAALLNVALVGFMSVFTLMFSGVKPNGASIMALWVTAGFAFFGKNVLNMIPLTFGVWLFAKYKKEPFINYSLSALLVATLTPVVSEIGFFGTFHRPVEIATGIAFGFLIGFIFPAVSAHTVKIHAGYDLYNMGFAGGLIAVIFSTAFRGFGLEILPVDLWSSGNNFPLAILLYSVSAAMLLFGLFAGSIKNNLIEFKKIFAHPGRLVTDYYFLHQNSVYINMGVLGIFATSVTLGIGAQLNGISIAGIFTIIGFGCFGKHLKNVVPVMAGAIISAYISDYLDVWDFVSPPIVAAILFSTALAPIAGHYGWIWGAIAGFLHVNVAMFVGEMNSGLNLYNNGFAAGFVAMFLLPLITTFKKEKEKES
ncbi:MAG: DUF1576 domain-containing protein [Oscillospiraceae bacterium]|nr:DUF1576 domain-containing protein [Oscillospiraceae bacterium]